MADYKEMYLTLLDATEKALELLIEAQRKCEELYISAEPMNKIICLERTRCNHEEKRDDFHFFG